MRFKLFHNLVQTMVRLFNQLFKPITLLVDPLRLSDIGIDLCQQRIDLALDSFF